MNLSPEQLSELLTRPESECLEFKEARNSYDFNDLCRYCVALANEGGGLFVLGVSNQTPRQIVGTSAFLDLRKAKQQLFEKLRVRIEVDELEIEDKRVVAFNIPGRSIGSPLDFEGSYLMRVGETLRPMTQEQLRKIFEEGKPDFLAELSLGGLDSDDIVRLLDTQIYFDLLGVPYPAERGGVLERFEAEGLIQTGPHSIGVTNLGALLFAKDINKFPSIKDKAPRVVTYAGTSKLEVIRDRIGNRGYVVAFENLIEYINTQIPSNEVIGRVFREEVRMFPEIAVRELVANALIHQDFDETGAFVAIEIYKDRIEITNPGIPPIQPDRLIDGYKSRNVELADLMRRLKICERQGSGIDKVISLVETWQLPAPDFRVGERRFSAILFSHMPFGRMDKNDKVRACYQHCTLKYLMNEKMTNQSLRERFTLSEGQSYHASRIISETLGAGMIKLDDPDSMSKRYAKYVPYWA